MKKITDIDQLAEEVMDAYNKLQLAKHRYDQLIEDVTETLGGAAEGTRKLVGEDYVIAHAQRTRCSYLDKKKFDELCPEMEAMGLVTRSYKEDKRAVLRALAKSNDNSEVVAFLRTNRITKLNKPILTVTKKA